MDFAFDSIWLKPNHGTNLKKESDENTNTKKIYNGCFSFNPEEIGPRIERPTAPKGMLNKTLNLTAFLNKNNLVTIH